MNIIVLHGDDTLKSYERLTKFTDEAKKRGWKVSDFSLSEIENQSLFGEEAFYVLCDYKQLDKKTLEKLKKYTGNLVVYNNGSIPTPTLKVINPNKIEKFELPVLLWKFLDSFDIKIFHELIKTQAPEYILAMMSWKLKQKYLKNPSKENGRMISELADIDVKAKTGKGNLLSLLELFIIKLKL